MMAHLDRAGWECTPAEEADLIIVNSCGFIESAKLESIEAVLEWRKLYPGKKILLAGCLAQRYAKELSGDMPEADGFFGVDKIEEITGIAGKLFGEELAQRHKGTKDTKKDSEKERKIESEPTGERPLLSLPGSAYVKISEGCDNCCSFCAIPLIRGSLASRTIDDIVEECRALLARGIKELCIIGQDIASFGIDSKKTSRRGAEAQRTQKKGKEEKTESLAELLNAISAIEGYFWVRLLYIHPDHFPLQILDIMERDPRFLPYFDIPFQHASQKILTAMNRRGSATQYLELLETIRSRLPRAVIRSTFLLGFPGETEDDFAALLDFQQKAKLDWLGCFTYSREEGTPAYSMKGHVPAKTALARKQMIEERQIPITEKNMERFAGETLEVLIEERIEAQNGEDSTENGESFFLGRLYCQAPEVDGAAVIVQSGTDSTHIRHGDLLPCKVIARRGFDLEVRLL
jgi:ribosomal protein S12 methylthiotransferase